MQDRREYILEQAFEVFMAKGYDSASITILQNQMKMSRGAMYRYFTNKEELFREVIDKYFFRVIGKLRPSLEDDVTLIEAIEQVYLHQKMVFKLLDNIESIKVKFLNYTALAIQAVKHYPGFLERLRVIEKESLEGWRRAINNSIEKGEIRADIEADIMARLFSKAINASERENDAMSCESEDFEQAFYKSVEGGKEIMDYLYSLIKV
jgi:AcrR family transcriptional regulator